MLVRCCRHRRDNNFSNGLFENNIVETQIAISISMLKCYYDEKMLFSFSLDSDSIFGKIAPCQLLRLNFKNKSDFLATISRLNCPPLPDSVPVELH